MEWNVAMWEKHALELANFLTPLTKDLGRSERRVGAARYIEGLLLPGGRKSIEPIAERLQVDAQSLQQFIADSPWEEEKVWSAVRREVIASMEPLVAWIVDETGWVKQGDQSVGVSHQYCGAVGKQANCQVAVEVVATDGQIAAPLAGRLYLPKSWADQPGRRHKAGVPEEIEFATKPEIALQLIDTVLADQVARAPVLGDSVYGDNGEFREGLKARGFEYFLQVTRSTHKGWTEEVKTQRKILRRYVAEGAPESRTLEQIVNALPAKAWQNARWKATDGTTRRTRLAWIEVFLAHNLRRPNGELEKVWLVADWPKGDQTPYQLFLAHLHSPPTRARCLLLARARWQVEQLIQRSKDDLGFDHYEGRSWRGFHHHHVLTAVAYLFVLVVYLRSKKNFWSDVGDDLTCDPALLGEVHRLLSVL